MAQLDILVAGGGLVGLAAAIGLRRKGHRAKVAEASPGLQVIGDAIALTANQQRVLKHYNMLDELHTLAVKDLGMMTHRRYEDGEIISQRDMRAQEANYGYASYILSRKNYQQFLYDQASKLGVEFLFNHRVETYEDSADRPAIIFQNGSRVEADLIVGADGVKSAIRNTMHPGVELTSPANCYRATLPHSTVEANPDLKSLCSGINFFMGPDRLIIQSNMTDIGVISLNMYHPGDTGSAGAWKAPGDIDHLRDIFKDFSLQIQTLVYMVDECIVWKVVQVPSLSSWVSDGGRVVLIGDAAHAMAPYQGQGCATGVEDGGALAECLDRIRSPQDIAASLHAFEKIRKPSVELIAAASSILGKVWSMPDGEQQQQRDENMRKTPIWSAGDWDGKPIDDVPTSLRDPKYQPWVMAHDAIEFAENPRN